MIFTRRGTLFKAEIELERPKRKATSIMLLLIFFAGCSVHNSRQIYHPSLDAFQTRNQCPEICWLGIHPGITTVDNALVILNSDDEIDRASIQVTDSEIHAVWFTEETKTFRSYVSFSTNNGVIVSMSARELAPFFLSDIVNLFGEPDEISISFWEDRHDAQYSVYVIYSPYAVAVN